MSLSRAVSMSLWSWSDSVGSRPSNEGSSNDKLFIFPLVSGFPMWKRFQKLLRGDRNLKSFRILHLPEYGDKECACNKHQVFCNFGSICQLAFHSCPHDSPGKLVKPCKHRGSFRRTTMLAAKDGHSTPTLLWLTGAAANHSQRTGAHVPVCRGCYDFFFFAQSIGSIWMRFSSLKNITDGTCDI